MSLKSRADLDFVLENGQWKKTHSDLTSLDIYVSHFSAGVIFSTSVSMRASARVQMI